MLFIAPFVNCHFQFPQPLGLRLSGFSRGCEGEAHCCSSAWFGFMDEVLGQRPSTRPPVLIASIREETPGPSSAVGEPEKDNKEEAEDESRQEPEKRKRKREDELLSLIREDSRGRGECKTTKSYQ